MQGLIGLGAVLLGTAGALALLQRGRPQAVAQRDERRRRALADEVLAIGVALRPPETLTCEIDEEAVRIDVVDPALRTAQTASTIVARVEFFAAQPSGSRPLDASERRLRAQYMQPVDAGVRIPVYRLPLQFSASANARDPAGFAAWRERLIDLPDRISIRDLENAAEAAYLATRSDDFDRTGFYMSRR